jgi:hypothetical protein
MAPQHNNKLVQAADSATKGELIAFAVAVGWFVMVALFFWMLPSSEVITGPDAKLRWVMMLIAIFMPIGLIWVAAVVARSARNVREQSFRVQTAIDNLRQMQMAQVAMQATAEPSVDQLRVELALNSDSTEPAVSGFTSRREVSRLIVPHAAPQVPVDQPALALGTSSEDMNPPLERLDLIQALNFPNDEHDTAGFSALRRALRDRTARRLVQASQDVLTLLSQDGIYMDDLRPDPISAEMWRRFAGGERGKAMDRLGGVRDRSSLALTAGRMREDTIFRDAVHHFLRRFDEMLVAFEEQAADTDLLELAETRTSRAFMLLARTTGTFD